MQYWREYFYYLIFLVLFNFYYQIFSFLAFNFSLMESLLPFGHVCFHHHFNTSLSVLTLHGLSRNCNYIFFFPTTDIGIAFSGLLMKIYISWMGPKNNTRISYLALVIVNMNACFIVQFPS